MSVNSKSNDLPAALQIQFQRLEKRLWWVDSILAVCGASMSLMISYALLFVSDRLWDTPLGLRVALTIAGLGAAVHFIQVWVNRWILKPRDTRALSGIVQRHYRRLGDRLLGIVELADESKRPANVSPELCRAAIRQVAEEATQFDFRQAVAMRRPRIYAVGALALTLLVLAPWMLVPEASWNTWSRWWWPTGNTPRYTFIDVHDLPGRLVVAHGEAFDITFGVRSHRWWNPETVTAFMDGKSQPKLQSPVSRGAVTLSVPAQTEVDDLIIQVGDVTHPITIEPLLRPALKEMRARLRYPDYLGHPPQEIAVDRGVLRMVEKSAITLTGLASRKLSSATMTVQPADGTVSSETNIQVRVEEERFTSAELTLTGGAEATFSWMDQHALTSAIPWRLVMQTRTDEAPSAECPEQAAVVAMLEDEVLEIQTQARDDFGLRDLAIRWECQKPTETNRLAAGLTVVAEGHPQAGELRGTFKLAPSLMKIPVDTLVTLRARARDYYPDRDATESLDFRIYILSQEEHARLVQQELEKIMADLEEVARRQESVLEAGREVARAESAMDPIQKENALESQASEQAELERKTAQLAERTASILKEALRNKTIPTELLQEWTEHAQTLRHIADQPMAAAANALQSAQQNEAMRTENLEEALGMESLALDQLMELQRKVGPAMDRMLANTLVQRFRRVAAVHADIRDELQTILPQTVGLQPEDLPTGERDLLNRLAREEKRARDQSLQLQDEVSRFYERTTETLYGAVAREMKLKETVPSLDELTRYLEDNVGGLAMREAEDWRSQFETWADKLEQARKDSESAGQSGGAGSMSEETLRRLLDLMRLRIREMALREHTRFLEEGREANQGHREDSIMLSLQQMFMRQDVDALDRSKPGKYLPYASQAMSDAEELLMKPQTGDPTVKAETDAVNLLESEINEMLKSAQGAGMVAAMSMMMEMMGMNANAGSVPGGNMAGGDTDAVNPSLEGDMKGDTAVDEDTERFSGGVTRSVPVEYREALQRYQKAVERLNATFEEGTP